MSARLLMIALDGADGRLLDRYSADGALPNLAALRARGRAKRLSAIPGLTDDALWASFQYATEIGEHGRYYWAQRDDRGFYPSHSGEVERDIFWDSLADDGLRIAVLDVPKCRAPRPLNGIHLVDWLVHGRNFREPQSYPPTLSHEILERFGPAPPSRCMHNDANLTEEVVRDVVGHLSDSIAKKRAAGLHFLQAEAWDLFIIAFKEMHCGCHTFWDFADPHHPAHDPEKTSRLGDPVLALLKQIDGAIGDLSAAAGPTAEIVVFSTTDMRPNGSLQPLLPKIVTRLNKYLTGGGQSAAAPGWRCQVLPYNEAAGAFRISHDRRIGTGGTPDTQQHARVVEEIRSILCDLTDAETGEKVVEASSRPSAEFKGARMKSLPDLLIHYKSNAFPNAVTSPRLGRFSGENPRMRPGNHAPGGFLIVAGSGVDLAAGDVNSMSDFARLANRVLRSANPV